MSKMSKMFRSTVYRELSVGGIEYCKDGHRCENGSKCVEDSSNENSYHCDCDEDSAGLYCSHTATEFCSIDNKHFCTNLGTCKTKVTSDEPHPGCTCRQGYVGNYCQFVQSTVSDEWVNKRDQSLAISPKAESSIEHSSGVTPLGFFLLVVFFMAFVVSTALLSRKILKKANDTANANDPEFIMEIEDDDEVLFDDIDDYDYGLQLDNPDSANDEKETKTITKKTETPKPIT